MQFTEAELTTALEVIKTLQANFPKENIKNITVELDNGKTITMNVTQIGSEPQVTITDNLHRRAEHQGIYAPGTK